MSKKNVAATIAKGAKVLIDEFSKSEKLQKIVLGQYNDGKPRSVVDAITGENMSPKEKAVMERRIEESKKKKKKAKKKGKKYAKIDLDD